MGLEVFAGQLFFAILVGALVGIEREHARMDYKAKIPFGVRTLIFLSVLGFLFSFVSVSLKSEMVLAIGVIASLIITTTVYLANVWTKRYAGATTYVSGIIVFVLGMIVGIGGYDNFLIAAIVAILITGFLITKKVFIKWTSKLTYDEIFGAVKFGVIAFIVLPLLPNRFIDPWNLFNPYKIWYVIVAVSAIYFLSYILLKQFSERGLVFSSFFGGLISSAVTVYNLALWLKNNKNLLNAVASSVFIACIATILSNVFVIGFVLGAWNLLWTILPAYVAGSASLFAFSYMNYRKVKHEKFEPDIKSPFEFIPALKFGIFYTSVAALSIILHSLFGSLGIYPVALVTSIVSSTTFIASIGSILQIGQVTVNEAAVLVIFASVISLAAKIFWIRTAKNSLLMKEVLKGVIVSSVAMAVTIAVQLMLFA